MFTVRLPALARPPHADGHAAEPAESPPTGRRILIVDDNVDGAETLALLLRMQGNDVRTVHDGEAALRAAQTFRPEVVFLDIGLPGMDGYEVARALRAMPELAGVRLAALTGYGKDEDRYRAREAGFDVHLVKPVDPERLEQILAGEPAPA